MSDFKPLRRKWGLVTLAMLLLLIGDWFRSYRHRDGVLIRGPRRFHILALKEGIFSWIANPNAPRDDGPANPPLIEPFTAVIDHVAEPMLFFYEDMLVEPKQQVFGFYFGLFDPSRTRIWKIPYWSIALPLILLSGYLLLSKPRRQLDIVEQRRLRKKTLLIAIGTLAAAYALAAVIQMIVVLIKLDWASDNAISILAASVAPLAVGLVVSLICFQKAFPRQSLASQKEPLTPPTADPPASS
jgi:hypothetical protein